MQTKIKNDAKQTGYGWSEIQNMHEYKDKRVIKTDSQLNQWLCCVNHWNEEEITETNIWRRTLKTGGFTDIGSQWYICV